MTQGEKKGSKTLFRWAIRFPKKNLCDIVIDGNLDTGQQWHSSVIVTRISANEVQTQSGGRYRLHGLQNVEKSVENGIPRDLAEHFLKGFPKNWIKLITSKIDKPGTIRKLFEQEEQNYESDNVNVEPHKAQKSFKIKNEETAETRKSEEEGSETTGEDGLQVVESKQDRKKGKTKSANQGKDQKSFRNILHSIKDYLTEAETNKCKGNKRERKNTAFYVPESSVAELTPTPPPKKSRTQLTKYSNENDEDSASVNEFAASQRKNNHRKMKKQPVAASRDMNEDPKQWTASERRLLRRAYLRLNPHSKETWNQVAKLVGTKSAQECHNEWFLEFGNVAKVEKKTNQVDVMAKPAGKNTAKFRQQLRRQWNEIENHHADDVMESGAFEVADDTSFQFDTSFPTPGIKGERKIVEENDNREEVDRDRVDFYISGMVNRRKKNGSNGTAMPATTKMETAAISKITDSGIQGAMTPGGSVAFKVFPDAFAYNFSSDEDESIAGNIDDLL